MQESLEIVGLREHYESTMRREAYKFQQQIDALTRQLEEEKKRSALLEAELIQYLRSQTASSSPASPTASTALLLNEEKTKLASVMIIDAREMNEKDGGRKYTAYVINIHNMAGDGWTLYKRFRQFEVLHFLLARRFGPNIPEFAPKHELISNAVKIPKRKAALQQYCNQILANPALATFPAVLDFFKQQNAA